MAKAKRSTPRAASEDPGLDALLAKADAAWDENDRNAEAFFAQEEKRDKAQAEMARRAQQSNGSEE